MAQRTFEAWEDPESGSFSCATAEEARHQIETGLLGPRARRLFSFEAASHEEAMAIFNIRIGFGPYAPNGPPAPCPECGVQYWPEGSAECWQCGHVG